MKVYEITPCMFKSELLKPICEDILEMNKMYLDTTKMYRGVNKVLGSMNMSPDVAGDILNILCVGMEATLNMEIYEMARRSVDSWLTNIL